MTAPTPPALWRDPWFRLALAAGPVVWGGLAWMGPAATGPAWIAERPGTFLLLAGAYPVVEELVFRGGVQGELARWVPRTRRGPVSAANLATSSLFSGLHLLSHPPLWAAAVFLPSLVFGAFRDRRGGVGAPILLHGWYNAGYFGLFPPG